MPGTYIFKPIEANLTHDTDWLGNMDPYCAYMINNQRIKGPVCKGGGIRPFWTDSVTVPIETDQPACVVELMDKDKIVPDASIGTFVIDLEEVKRNGSVSKWYPVYHRNKPAGEILFEAAYQPEFGENMPYQQATEIMPTFVETPIISEAQPVIQETIVTEKVITEPIIVPQSSQATHTVLQSTLTSYGLEHSGKGCLEDPLYGKTVGVKNIAHTGGIPTTCPHFSGQSHLSSQPLGSNINQPLGSNITQSSVTQANQPLISHFHQPSGSNINQPMGSQLNQPLGSNINQPMGSQLNQPLGSNINQPLGSRIEQPLGSQVNQPLSGQIGSQTNQPIAEQFTKNLGTTQGLTKENQPGVL